MNTSSGYTLLNSIFNRRVSAPTQKEGCKPCIFSQRVPYFIPSSIGASVRQPKRKATINVHFFRIYSVELHLQAASHRVNPKGSLHSINISPTLRKRLDCRSIVQPICSDLHPLHNRKRLEATSHLIRHGKLMSGANLLALDTTCCLNQNYRACKQACVK